MTVTERLVDFVVGSQFDDIPKDVVHETKRVLLDCIGCAVAGTTSAAGRIAIEFAKRQTGPEEASVPGLGARTSAVFASFANSILMNSLDYEPVGPEGHVCAAAVPATLALAEFTNTSGKDLITALGLALEVGGRVGASVRRPAAKPGEKWPPPTRGTCHAVFGAVVAGKLLRLSRQQMANAFGIAGYSAPLPTMRKFMAAPPVPMTKYDNLGVLTQAGVQASLLASMGFTGDKNVLDGDHGFWRFSGHESCDWAALTDGLGDKWLVGQTFFKKYPVGLYLSVPIDVALELVSEHAIDPDRIGRITVQRRRWNPVQTNTEITSDLDAWGSFAFNMAAAISGIRPWRDWHSPRTVGNPNILDLMRRVVMNPDVPADWGEKPYWEGFSPARVEIVSGNKAYEETQFYLHRLTDSELAAKFRDNTSGILNPAQAEKLLSLCTSCETLPEVRSIGQLLRGVSL